MISCFEINNSVNGPTTIIKGDQKLPKYLNHKIGCIRNRIKNEMNNYVEYAKLTQNMNDLTDLS